MTAEALTVEEPHSTFRRTLLSNRNLGTPARPCYPRDIRTREGGYANPIKRLGNSLSCYRNALTPPPKTKTGRKPRQRKRPTSQKNEESAANQCVDQGALVGVCNSNSAYTTITFSHSRLSQTVSSRYRSGVGAQRDSNVDAGPPGPPTIRDLSTLLSLDPSFSGKDQLG